MNGLIVSIIDNEVLPIVFAQKIYWNYFRINWRIAKGRKRHSLVQDMQNLSERLVPWSVIHNTAFIMRNCWILKVSRIQSYTINWQNWPAKETDDMAHLLIMRIVTRSKVLQKHQMQIEKKHHKNKPKTTVKTTTTTTKLTATVTARRNSLQISI